MRLTLLISWGRDRYGLTSRRGPVVANDGGDRHGVFAHHAVVVQRVPTAGVHVHRRFGNCQVPMAGGSHFLVVDSRCRDDGARRRHVMRYRASKVVGGSVVKGGMHDGVFIGLRVTRIIISRGSSIR